MTAQEAIRRIDDRKHNVYSAEEKLLWLGQVEQMAAQLRERCGLPAQTQELTPDAALSVPAPFDELYLRYLEAQIDYTGQEYLKYNNAMAMFSSLWQEYANALRRAGAKGLQRRFF